VTRSTAGLTALVIWGATFLLAYWFFTAVY
jgi:hypothetical protein